MFVELKVLRRDVWELFPILDPNATCGCVVNGMNLKIEEK